MYTHIYNILNKYEWFVSGKYACFVCVLHTHLERMQSFDFPCLTGCTLNAFAPHTPTSAPALGGAAALKAGFPVSLVTSGDAVASCRPGCPLLPSPGAEQELFGPGDEDRSEPQSPPRRSASLQIAGHGE